MYGLSKNVMRRILQKMYTQSMFSAKIRKIMFNPVNHSLAIITETSPNKNHQRFPDLHLANSKNGENLGLVLNDKKSKFLHRIICCGDLLESPRGGDSNR